MTSPKKPRVTKVTRISTAKTRPPTPKAKAAPMPRGRGAAAPKTTMKAKVITTAKPRPRGAGKPRPIPMAKGSSAPRPMQGMDLGKVAAGIGDFIGSRVDQVTGKTQTQISNAMRTGADPNNPLKRILRK